ncbi:FAD-dependent oxidoreductase [Vibrio ruber]|uniref:FAD-dependent oxidoreductase n=1 Tax=Vibrio ruber TaxID=184755 RepID=UPI002893240C|nr:FAD-dependent oxidoreductase [Vibrio ruber]WNJ96292.1 FAD-dependent oxidoreductase [Vibrio ruber]
MSDYIIIGGGPSAAIEAKQLSRMGKSITLIAEQFGGIMRVMGERPLQSYCNELELPNSHRALQDYVQQCTFSPKACEYMKYINDYLDQLPITKVTGHVVFIEKQDKSYICHVKDSSSIHQYTASNLVLATGVKPKDIQHEFSGIGAITCIDAYRLFSYQNRPALLNKKEVVIIGSGNSAFQLAESASTLGMKVTILAKCYLGIFPQETDDIFALRAPTQKTIERIWKSQTDHKVTRLNFHIYAEAIRENDYMKILIRQKENTPHIAKHCYEHLFDTPLQQEKELFFNINETLFVSSIGTCCQIPENNISNLDINPDGFIENNHGQTTVEGLYVTGTLAGARSVNTMNQTSYA